MSSKNALLFFLAVFGVLFIGVEALLPVLGLGGFAGALYTAGGLMLVLFLALVLGFGFIFKVVYLIASVGVVSYAATALAAQDFVMGAIFAVVSFILLALIPTVFLKK